MSTTESSETQAREREANVARDALAEDLGRIDERTRAAASTAETIVRRGTSVAPLVAAGVGVVTLAGLVSAGSALAKLAGRATAGLLAGAVAGAAMSQVDSVWSLLAKRIESADRRHIDEEGSGGDPATVKAAQALVGPIEDDARKARAGTIAHYTMGAVAGAAYALAAPAAPLATIGRGTAYGALVWLVADETMVPVFGLSAPPWRSPLATHARALLAHLVYGAVLDASLRLIRRATG